ncbi:MAG TPA: hypothetical protein VNE40_04360 [Candidatus Dormibacteraeota bacterium]|nr:hypothetical protein [Candidatus Dormibacteraeota bacterium]
MKISIIYRPSSDHGKDIESFIQDFRRRHDSSRVEVLNIDSREGSAMASLYDVMNYPAILVLQDDGTPIKVWEGEVLPLMDEIAYYTFSA